jgi:mRNA-degrading endonuclease RelE of RelBE toxin-antitoxin system
MSYRLSMSPEYDKSLKELAKKHRSMKKDVAKLYDDLEENPYQGVLIGENTYKIRLAITRQKVMENQVEQESLLILLTKTKRFS